MGRLSESETEPVEEHLLLCSVCQDTLTETEDFLRALRTATEQMQAQPVAETWWFRWRHALTKVPKPVFAVVACALALLVVIPTRTRNPVVVELQAMRGPESAAAAPANSKLTLRVPLPSTASVQPGQLEIRVANLSGIVVAQAPAKQSDEHAVAQIDGLSQGVYWARLYSGEQIVGEYGLNVR